MSVTVERPGLLTTVQDLGRSGYQQHGVTPGGAMDPVALRLANPWLSLFKLSDVLNIYCHPV